MFGFSFVLPQQTWCSPLQWVRKPQHPARWAGLSTVFFRAALCSSQASPRRTDMESGLRCPSRLWVSYANQVVIRWSDVRKQDVHGGQVLAWLCSLLRPPRLTNHPSFRGSFTASWLFSFTLGFQGLSQKVVTSSAAVENDSTRSQSSWRAGRSSDLVPVQTWLELKWVLTRIYNWKFTNLPSAQTQTYYFDL